jgi:ArsR family transcriptional regulator
MPQSLVPPDQRDAVAQRFRLLGEPVRLELLEALHAEGKMSVGELVEATGHRQANVSKHLGLMADDGLLTRNREGVHVYYAIDDATLSALCLLVSTQLQKEDDGDE